MISFVCFSLLLTEMNREFRACSSVLDASQSHSPENIDIRDMQSLMIIKPYFLYRYRKPCDDWIGLEDELQDAAGRDVRLELLPHSLIVKDLALNLATYLAMKVSHRPPARESQLQMTVL